jgi:hypothetical protein
LSTVIFLLLEYEVMDVDGLFVVCCCASVIYFPSCFGFLVGWSLGSCLPPFFVLLSGVSLELLQ